MHYSFSRTLLFALTTIVITSSCFPKRRRPSLRLQPDNHCPRLPGPAKKTFFSECPKTSLEIRQEYGPVQLAFVRRTLCGLRLWQSQRA